MPLGMKQNQKFLEKERLRAPEERNDYVDKIPQKIGKKGLTLDRSEKNTFSTKTRKVR